MIVYWIHKKEHTDPHSEGYVGITGNYTRRMSEHRENNRLDMECISILFEGTDSECISMEEELRPDYNIGWNQNKGGVIPPSRKGKDPWNKGKTYTLGPNPNKQKPRGPHSEQSRKNISESLKGKKKDPKSVEQMRKNRKGKGVKPIKTPFGQYNSIRECSQETGIPETTLTYRCKNMEGYEYI